MAKKSIPPQRRALRVAQKGWAKFVVNPFKRLRNRYRSFLKRRPHRSFRRTRQRDMPKLAPLPSNTFFTAEVFGVARRNKRAYIVFALVYVVLFTFLAGISSQTGYIALSDGIRDFGPSIVGGEIDNTTRTLALFGAAAFGALNDPLSEAQQVYVAILGIFTWLSIVWFLRHRLAGDTTVKVRDAIYNSGAPFISTLLVALVLMIQALPGAIAIVVYFALQAAGTITGGIESMMFAVAAGLFVLMSLYWITSTLFALVIVTIPGTYPMRAIALAGDVVIGRRLSILVRSLWLALMVVLLWVFVLVPVVLVAEYIPWDWVPLIPVTVQILTAVTFLFAATYVYLLYRRMIDEPAGAK